MYSFPYYMQIAPVAGNPPECENGWKVWNRTGGASVIGGIYQFDHFRSLAAAEGTANTKAMKLPAVVNENWNRDDSAWRNVVAPGQRNTSNVDLTMFGAVFCVAQQAVADNEEMDVIVVGHTTVKVIGAASAVYGVRSPIRVTTGQVYGTMLIAATAPLGRVVGWLTSTEYTEAGTPAATAHTVFFSGFGLQ